MTAPHDIYIAEHGTIREKARALDALVRETSPRLSEALKDFQILIRSHFDREDPYYRILDDGKRVEDRGLIHQLRNDHAAVIFTLESLAIRLRKNGVNDEWLQRFKNLMNVLLPHLDQEEKSLFPIGRKLLSTEEIHTIAKHITSHE